jgi:hypothetical protein
MDATVARATLVSYLGGTSARPALDEAEIDALLSRFRIADSAGLRPDDAGWSPTYALNAAAAEGWRIKGARVAGDFNFSADNASFSKGDVLAHCLDMEAKFASLDMGSLYLDGGVSDYKGDRLWL